MLRIGLIGDFDPEVKAHVAIPRALALAANDLEIAIDVHWLATPDLEHNIEQTLAPYHALWSVPATPYASMEGALGAIRFARERGLPFLGTCGGFQHAVIEYARNVLGRADAEHAESNPEASFALITPLVCSVSELTQTFTLVPGSQIAAIYRETEVVEQYGICNYGIATGYLTLLEQGGMHVTGTDKDGNARIIELPSHPFYIGTLYQPERSAFRDIVHPLIKAFLQATTRFASVEGVNGLHMDS